MIIEYPRKLNVQNYQKWEHHRDGWQYCVKAIEQTMNSEDGTLFYPNHVVGMLSHRKLLSEWTGFLHLTRSCIEKLPLRGSNWIRSLEKCKGVFLLSEYAAQAFREKVDIPVDTVYYATPETSLKFSFEDFLKTKDLIFVGHWLREYSLFLALRTILNKSILKCPLTPIRQLKNKIKIRERLENDEYDRMLQKSVIFLHMKDCSANTAVIECIARNTPVLINKLPAAVEYLGENYPFYFENDEEATEKASDLDLIQQTSEYLATMDKSKINIKTFLSSIASSKTLQQL